MKERIKQLAEKYHETVVGYRRHLHMYPELSFEEVETSRYIKKVIADLGLEYREDLGGGTGITVDVGQGDKTIALRGDIDALPIQETSDHDYVSQHAGKMHACGHDVHTSSLLGVLHILNDIKDDLTCRYRFIFQPGEELLPGGASKMIADDVLKNPTVDMIYGQHVHPSLPVGQVGIKPDYFMASCDELYITVTGKGGHGAMPQDVIDPIYVSAEIITSLQSIISRKANPGTPSVLSIGKINSEGGASNVIPSKVYMVGTFRTFDEPWRDQAHQYIHEVANNICEAHGASAEVEIKRGYPSLYNNPEVTATAKTAMIEYLGAEQVIDLPQRMTAEDFSYYSHEVPACFYRLGTASLDGTKSSPVHTPTFDIDEGALKVSIGLMAYIAYASGQTT